MFTHLENIFNIEYIIYAYNIPLNKHFKKILVAVFYKYFDGYGVSERNGEINRVFATGRKYLLCQDTHIEIIKNVKKTEKCTFLS
jgi:hypothetical protein